MPKNLIDPVRSQIKEKILDMQIFDEKALEDVALRLYQEIIRGKRRSCEFCSFNINGFCTQGDVPSPILNVYEAEICAYYTTLSVIDRVKTVEQVLQTVSTTQITELTKIERAALNLESGKTANTLVTTYLKNACILPSNTIVADPTGNMVSYEGGYACRALIFKAGTGEVALAKSCLDEFVNLQNTDGSWYQQYRPERLADGKHDKVEDLKVDSGASLLAHAMADYDAKIGAGSTVYKSNVQLAFNFLREAQLAHYNAYGTGLLANQKKSGSWNTTALAADCAEALLATLAVLDQYGDSLQTQNGYSIKSFGNDLNYAIATWLWTFGSADGYYRTEYPLGAQVWGLPTVLQGISFTQALCAMAIYKWGKSAHQTSGDYSAQSEKALNWITALGMGKWGGFHYSPYGGMPLTTGFQPSPYDAYPAFTAFMIMAYNAVNPTKYARQIERAKKFIQLSALPDGEVYNVCRITSALGETPDVEGHYHFRVSNSALGLLAGA